MPKFVPVLNPELARHEQDPHSEDNQKHRKFDNPHTVAPKVNRGWESGTLGWGVQGAFGSNEKDQVAQVVRHGDGPSKMVKNEKGLWVKAKSVDESVFAGSGRGTGRGGDVSVLEMLGRGSGLGSSGASVNPNPNTDRTYARSNNDSGRYEDHRRDQDRNRDRDSDRGRQRRNSRDRDRDRDKDGRRYDYPDRERQRNNGGSSQHYYNRGDSRDRDQRDEPSIYRERARGRSGDRDRDRDRDRDGSFDSRVGDVRGGGYRDRSRDRSPDHGRRVDVQQTSRASHHSSESNELATKKSRSETYIPIDARESHPEGDESKLSVQSSDEAESDAVPQFTFTAPQIINRFIELFADARASSDTRLNHLMDLFHKDISISSLKSEKALLVGADAVRQSFTRTQACFAESARRVYIPCPTSTAEKSCASSGTENDGNTSDVASGASKAVSYVLDLHVAGATPGLGDRSKDTVLLYECDEAAVKITRVWGAADPDKLASKPTLTLLAVCQSQAWKWALGIILKQYPSFDHTNEIHFHDYTNIETI